MSAFHVQRIRSCVQCGSVLSQKCSRCARHPDRKPSVIELFDFPPILATAECGCCVKVQCQREGCPNTFWRYIRTHYKNAKWPAKTFCCGHRCATAVANGTKAAKVAVNCAYCGKSKLVIPSVFKIRRHIFCDPSHHYLWVRKTSFEAKAALKKDKAAAMLWCNRCRDIVDCRLTNKRLHVYICNRGHRLNILAIEREHIIKASEVGAMI